MYCLMWTRLIACNVRHLDIIVWPVDVHGRAHRGELVGLGQLKGRAHAGLEACWGFVRACVLRVCVCASCVHAYLHLCACLVNSVGLRPTAPVLARLGTNETGTLTPVVALLHSSKPRLRCAHPCCLPPAGTTYRPR